VPKKTADFDHKEAFLNPEHVQHRTVDKQMKASYDDCYCDEENFPNTTGNKDRKRRKVMKTLVLSNNKPF
jgi:hypothetical protein